MNLSKNALGFATLLVVVFGLLGVELDISTATGAVEAVLTIISFGLMAYNQWSRPEVDKFFFKV